MKRDNVIYIAPPRVPKYRWPAGTGPLTRAEAWRIRGYFIAAALAWVAVWVWLWAR
jgi:hypothetical protein